MKELKCDFTTFLRTSTTICLQCSTKRELFWNQRIMNGLYGIFLLFLVCALSFSRAVHKNGLNESIRIQTVWSFEWLAVTVWTVSFLFDNHMLTLCLFCSGFSRCGATTPVTGFCCWCGEMSQSLVMSCVPSYTLIYSLPENDTTSLNSRLTYVRLNPSTCSL